MHNIEMVCFGHNALQKMSTTRVSKNWFTISKKLKTDFRTIFLPYLLNRLSYRPAIFTQNRLRGALHKMSTTRVSKNQFTISKKLKTDFQTIFGFFGTPFWPYLPNRLSYIPKIFTGSRLQQALQKMSTTGIS